MLSNNTKIIGVVIIFVQLFDIVIHAATDQLELLRVASNLIILVWVLLILAGKLSAQIKRATLGSLGVYLGFNLIFLVLEGFTNPNTDAPRTILFLLVVLTTAFSLGIFAQLKKT